MLDMWYGNKISEIDKIDIFFSDLDCVYRGNCYIKGKAVGDYKVRNSTEIEKLFPHLIIEWG